MLCGLCAMSSWGGMPVRAPTPLPGRTDIDWGRHPCSTLGLLLLAPEPTGVKERFCSSGDSYVAEVEDVPSRTESVVVVIFDSSESSSVLTETMVGIGAELPRVGCRWMGAGTEIGWEW